MKKFLLLICLPITTLLCRAQTPEAMLPSAGSMGVVSQVNHSAGMVQISLPLLTLTHFGISVPIELKYNATGVKVEERPAEVGMSWRLSAGGKITRIVKGRPDDLTLSSQWWGRDKMDVAHALYVNVDNKLELYNDIDIQPDLFYYEIPGKSGMFVLDGENKPQTIPQDRSVRITLIGGNHFMIKDNAGTTYILGADDASREKTSVKYKNENLKKYYQERNPQYKPFHDCKKERCEYYISETRFGSNHFQCNHNCRCPHHKAVNDIFSDQMETLDYVSTWHLNSIESYSIAKHKVSFNYVAGDAETIDRYTDVIEYKLKKPPFGTEWGSEQKSNKVSTQTEAKIIKSIAAEAQSVIFGVSNNRITSFKHIIASDEVNNYSLSYVSNGGRPMLSTISFKNSPLYGFTYDSMSLPSYYSWSFDSWGYYNGKINGDNIPPFDDQNSNHPKKENGADRTPSLQYAKARVLTGINYVRNGGRTTYDYELNKYRQYDVGGLRVKQVSQYDTTGELTYKTTYSYEDPTLGGLGEMPGHALIYPNRFVGCPITLSSRPINELLFATGSPIMYGTITETALDGGRTEYKYTTPDKNPLQGTSDVSLYRDFEYGFWSYYPATSNIRESIEGGKGSNDFLERPLISPFWLHGLPMKITHFDKNNLEIDCTTFHYVHDENPGSNLSVSELVAVPGFQQFIGLIGPMPQTCLFSYQWESRPVLLASTTTTSLNKPTATTYYEYENEWLAPSSVTQTSAGNTVRTEYKYVKEWMRKPSPAATLNAAGVVAPQETVTWRNGKIVAAEYIKYGWTAGQKYTLPYAKCRMFIKEPIDKVDFEKYTEIEQYSYDDKGNISCITTPEGLKTSFFYDNYGNVIREVANAAPNEISGDKIPAGAREKKYTYKQGVGLTSETDHNGRTTYREYDDMGRLKRVLNNERQMVEEYEYHSRN